LFLNIYFQQILINHFSFTYEFHSLEFLGLNHFYYYCYAVLFIINWIH